MKLDHYLPDFQFSENHNIVINAGPDKVFRAIKEVTFSELSVFFNILLYLRDLPSKLFAKSYYKPAPSTRPMLDEWFDGDFLLLEEVTESEIVFGLIGAFWKLTPQMVNDMQAPDDFLKFDKTKMGKCAANFLISSDQSGKTVLSTETRIFVKDNRARHRFRIYWFMIRLFSGWIRIMMLKAMKRRAEKK